MKYMFVSHSNENVSGGIIGGVSTSDQKPTTENTATSRKEGLEREKILDKILELELKGFSPLEIAEHLQGKSKPKAETSSKSKSNQIELEAFLEEVDHELARTKLQVKEIDPLSDQYHQFSRDPLC